MFGIFWSARTLHILRHVPNGDYTSLFDLSSWVIAAVFALPSFLLDGLLPLLTSYWEWFSDWSCSSHDNWLLNRSQIVARIRSGNIDGDEGLIILIEKISDIRALVFVLHIRNLMHFLCSFRAIITTVGIASTALSLAPVFDAANFECFFFI